MKILITGAGGMLGSDLSLALAGQNLLGVGLAPNPKLSTPFYLCDLSGRDTAAARIRDFGPEVIFHTAAMTQVDRCETEREEALRHNVEATRVVAQSAKSAGALLIFFSTDYVFDGTQSGEYQEDDPPCPANFYGETKLEAEEVIRQTAPAYLIFRISWLFGLYGASFPRSILARAFQRQPLTVVEDQKGRPTSSRDLAQALADLILRCPERVRSNRNQIFNLANDGVTTWYDYAKLLLKLSGQTEVPLTPILSRDLDRKAKRPTNSVLDLRKSENRLGIRLRAWQAAVEDFFRLLDKEVKA